MKPISKTAAAVMDTLRTKARNGAVKLDNAPGMYMPLCFEKIGTATIGPWQFPLFSVAHYGEQNGDAMRDPDVVLLAGTRGDYYPVSYRNDYLGLYQEAVKWDGVRVMVNGKLQRSIAALMTTWAKNIKAQQGI